MLQNRQMNGMLQIMNKKREMAAAISGSHFFTPNQVSETLGRDISWSIKSKKSQGVR